MRYLAPKPLERYAIASTRLLPKYRRVLPYPMSNHKIDRSFNFLR
ncbi:hypothetical protein [Brunnivagina elsteri]|nr:hypothetical protein [Calothrix elsteri]